MTDYLTLNKYLISCSAFSSDVCSSPHSIQYLLFAIMQEYPTLFRKSISFYIDCKEKFNIDALTTANIECQGDEECEFGGIKNK